MNWRGKELVTVGDISTAMQSCATKEEAQEFMKLYRADSPYADSNIGYLTGYFGREEMIRMQDWFGVAHPVFGNAVPTPEEAFEAGQRMVEQMRRSE